MKIIGIKIKNYIAEPLIFTPYETKNVDETGRIDGEYDRVSLEEATMITVYHLDKDNHKQAVADFYGPDMIKHARLFMYSLHPHIQL